MNIARTLCVFRHQSIGKKFVRNFRISSSKFDSTQATQPQVKEERFDFEDLKVVERTERRKAKIEPFMKNVFTSVFDRDILAYPEILNKEESEALEQRVSALEKVFSDPNKTSEDRKEALKRTKLFAGPVSLTRGGLAMNYTESLRYLETVASDVELGQQISDHWVGLEAIKHGLSPDQYSQIIDDLVTGEKTISLCIKETVAKRLTQADFRTTAELDGQGIWRINGEKVCNRTDGYKFVLASVEAERLKGFLVHPNVSGVSYEDNRVNFLNTPATPLDFVNETTLSQTLAASRLHAAVLARRCLAKALDATARYVHECAFTGKPLSELSTIRVAFGEALLTLYASESAEYLTAGLMDGYEEPDAELEMAMCRNFMALHAMPALLRLLSIPALEMPDECDRHMDEMRRILLRGETLDSVNFFIGLTGIHHAGKNMAEEIRQIRNPLMNPVFIMKKVFANRHQERDEPKLTLYLAEHLHPTLKPAADQLEYCVVRMKYACETMLSRHGTETAQAYTELARLAEAATEILALTAVLARASRSYCIGLRNSEVEMKLASCFVEKTKNRVKSLIREIDDGEYLNLDHFKVDFGKKILETKSLIVEKPTSRVFW